MGRTSSTAHFICVITLRYLRHLRLHYLIRSNVVQSVRMLQFDLGSVRRIFGFIVYLKLHNKIFDHTKSKFFSVSKWKRYLIREKGKSCQNLGLGRRTCLF